ncbi:LysR substrate-binding domain-containing protein [Oceanospirillum beijerinckii]|uniref:LysR substrate-binding domain-containing protein n=1 Tax=Oceanospirillum beijerinckii TaxID=64976 RepID=UPI000424ECE5|nr:LysR substrate-binding domain-containing protein [Oceanospirillum beijerinckii]
MQVQSASQCLEAIQTGQQICLIDRPFVERELASGELVQVCNHSHHGNRSYYLAVNQEAVDKVCLQQFRDWLLGLCQ